MCETTGVCISCLETDSMFNIFDTHECDGLEEIYVEMLKSCFDVSISNNPSYMCEKCILTLRSAYYLKQNIIKNLNDDNKIIIITYHIEEKQKVQAKYEELLSEKDENLIKNMKNEEGNREVKEEVTAKNNKEDNKHERGGGAVRSGSGAVFYLIQNREEDRKIQRNRRKEKEIPAEATQIECAKEKELSGATQFECVHCSKRFSNKMAFSRHWKTHIEGQFSCHICDQVFTKKNTRNCHMWRAHHSCAYACARCPQRFPTFHTRLAHLRAAHGEVGEYPCPYCDNVYNYAGARSTHIRQKHLRLNNHECSECKRKFFKRRGLLVHLASKHGIGEKKFACPVCGKSFYRNPTLTWHMKRHTDKQEKQDKKYQCSICAAEFTYQTVLRNHMKLHELQLQGDAGERRPAELTMYDLGDGETVDEVVDGEIVDEVINNEIVDEAVNDDEIDAEESNDVVYFEVDVD